MPQPNGPSVECVLCGERYTEEDILKYEFFIESGVCYRCYRRMYRQAPTVSCFGKSGKLGFNPLAKECRLLCPDRKACPLFMTKQIKTLRIHTLDEVARKGALNLLKKPRDSKERDREHPFRSGSVIHEAFEMCRRGVSAEDFSKWAERTGCTEARLLRLFRAEELYGKEWKWTESEGRCKIAYPVA